MSHPIEITIRISNDEKTAIHKYLVYEEISLPNSPRLLEMIDAAQKSFGPRTPIDDIVIKCKMVLN